MNSWEIYDQLIEKIDPNIHVDRICQGIHWTTVRANNNTGIAMTIRQKGPRMVEDRLLYERLSLKKLAMLSKSWDYYEASIGTAALNCYYNTVSNMIQVCHFEKRDQRLLKEKNSIKNDAFDRYFDQIKGKKVAVIGHFPAIEKRLGKHCQLMILEREPQPGDYPDPANEYLLTEQDYIFLTGTTFTNKTLPRLLELCGQHSKVFMVGPSVCFSDVFFDHGVDVLSGFCVRDQNEMEHIVSLGGQMEIFDYGMMLNGDKKQ